MAIIHSHIFDNASGSVGNVTISRYKGKNIAKGKICFKSKKQSAAQVCQQIRFKALSDIAFHFYTAIRAGITSPVVVRPPGFNLSDSTKTP